MVKLYDWQDDFRYNIEGSFYIAGENPVSCDCGIFAFTWNNTDQWETAYPKTCFLCHAKF